jgi:hypothetical protein
MQALPSIPFVLFRLKQAGYDITISTDMTTTNENLYCWRRKYVEDRVAMQAIACIDITVLVKNQEDTGASMISLSYA